MSVLVSHPTGNANLRSVLRGLARADLLHGFWTALALPPALTGMPWPGTALQRELGRRSFPELSWRHTHARPYRELTRIVAFRLGLRTLTRHETSWASIDRMYHAHDAWVARVLERPGSATVQAVYAYEDGALSSFRAARARGLCCLYDLPIAHWRMLRRLLQEEAELHPAWAGTMAGLRDSAAKLARKDEELILADRVVVASSFTRASVEAQFGTELPVSVIPYGAPAPVVTAPAARSRGARLRALYAGHLNQRKGMAYLIRAMQRLDVPWHLTLAGPKPTDAPQELDDFLADPRCTWLGHVPHATLLEHMARAHVFVFPSIVEGFAMVLYEAMAAGLPVITTPHTAGPDILTDGVEGFLTPIRDPDATAARLARLYADEPARYAMGEAALARAAGSHWRAYEDATAAMVREALS